MMDAATIEQTNKIRQSLGLGLLPVPGVAACDSNFSKRTSSESSDEEPASTLETREAAGYQNYKEVQDRLAARKRREAVTAAVKKARDNVQRFTKLEGSGLGDAIEDVDMDARTWLMGHNKRKKQIGKERARRMEQELAEREKLAAAEYTAGDLVVAHEFDSIKVDVEHTFTLVDATIDGKDEDDELENLELREHENLRENIELKKRKPVYDPNSASEDAGILLPQYTEEIEGKKRKRFILDGQGESLQEREPKSHASQNRQTQSISVDFLKYEPKSDYMDIGEIKIKKPKKPKRPARHRYNFDTDIADAGSGVEINILASSDEAMEVGDSAQPNSSSNDFLFDDDDLQSALARQRTAALNKRRRQRRPEDIIRELREETEELNSEAVDNSPGLVINESSEFVSRLRRQSSTEQELKSGLSPHVEGSRVLSEDADRHARIESPEDQPKYHQRQASTGTTDVTASGLEEESRLDNGLAATFSLLRSRGILKPAEGDANTHDRQRALFMQEKRRRELDAEQQARNQRQQQRAAGTYDKFSARERENARAWENKQRDDQLGRQMAQLFDQNYRPQVNIRHVDEFSRELTPKEAFKQLSVRQFLCSLIPSMLT